MEWIIGVPAVAMVVGAFVTWVVVSRHRGSWGLVFARRAEVGDGPYRGGGVDLFRRRRMPSIVAVASALSIGWGLITMLVFAPAGIVLCLFALPGAGQHPLNAIGFAALMLAIIHGFIYGARLVGLSPSLIVHARAESSDAIRSAVLTTLAQHLLVAAAFAMIALPVDGDLFWIAAVPCAVGLALSVILTAAWSAHRRADGV